MMKRIVWNGKKLLREYPKELWQNSWYLLSDNELKRELDNLFDSVNNFVNLFVKESSYRKTFDITPIQIRQINLDNLPNSLKDLPVFMKHKPHYQNINEYLQAQKELAYTKLKCRKCKELNVVDPNKPLRYQTPVGISLSILEPVLTVIGQSLHSYSLFTPKFQIPFKGNIPAKDSGIILYTALQLAGFIERWNFTITNIVACHPVNNQPNKPEWIQNCRPIFLKELNVYKPEILLLVGNSAKQEVQKLIPNTKLVFKSRYTTVEEVFDNSSFDSVKLIITTYHPSYIQRRYGFNSKQTWDYIQDLSNTIKQTCLTYQFPYITLNKLLKTIYPESISFYDVNFNYRNHTA